jgi:HEAT repeat protein
LPHPGVAAGAVADAFAAGNLQARLGTLELLRAWRAPVTDLDPWRPDTLTAAHLDALRRWAAHPGPAPSAAAELTAEQLADVRREMARLLQATDAEAAAVCERLARHGRALLPEVSAQLRQAATDQARERLTALRYRLVAPPGLALAWPGGLERLAATRAAVRQQAAQELAGRATAAEEPLLLELFASPDPLVREISLRALQEVAGPRATAALTGLLHDPEPNVRAAVLKRLAEQPSPGMVAPVAAYVAGEKDPDLLVHAIRALRESRADAARECLKTLLSHPSWRVRAEAAEALGKVLESSSDEEVKADVCVALIKVLEDPDGFVVSRAIPGLKRADLATAVEPLVRAARTHPDLATEVIRALSSGAPVSPMRQKAVPHLRAFCAHPDPAARAAAVAALCDLETPGFEKELAAGLQDKSGQVRRAAAQALFAHLGSQRSNRHERGDTAESDEELDRFRKGLERAEWTAGLAALLRPLLAAAEPEERLDGGLALVALAGEPQAAAVLVSVAKGEPSLAGKAAAALPWLPWSPRLELFDHLLECGPGPEPLSVVVEQLARVRDRRTVPRLWDLAADARLKEESAEAILEALLRGYFGDGVHTWSGHEMQITASDRKQAAAAARPRVDKGPELQRLLALSVLLTAAPEDAAAVAERLLADAGAGAEMHRDAFVVLLWSRSGAERSKAAIAGLGHAEPAIRDLALEVLARRVGAFESVLHGRVALHPYESDDTDRFYRGSGSPVVVDAPRDLRPEAVRPFLRSPNPRTAALAGYLLAVLREPEGLEPLVRYWRAQPRKDDVWVRLVYRAVSALGDDSRVALLEEVYRNLQHDQPYELPEFYWTIRAMDGPNVLRLRKQIRQDVGIDALR